MVKHFPFALPSTKTHINARCKWCQNVYLLLRGVIFTHVAMIMKLQEFLYCRTKTGPRAGKDMKTTIISEHFFYKNMGAYEFTAKSTALFVLHHKSGREGGEVPWCTHHRGSDLGAAY